MHARESLFVSLRARYNLWSSVIRRNHGAGGERRTSDLFSPGVADRTDRRRGRVFENFCLSPGRSPMFYWPYGNCDAQWRLRDFWRDGSFFDRSSSGTLLSTGCSASFPRDFFPRRGSFLLLLLLRLNRRRSRDLDARN